MNSVHLVGRVGSVEWKEIGAGVLSIRLCTTRTWKTNGEQKRQDEWHSVCKFGEHAKNLMPHIGVGDIIGVVGRIHYSQNGEKHYTNIDADQIEFIQKRKPEGDDELPA